MNKGIILNASDVKRIIAEYYNVSEDKVIQSKYSYIVIEQVTEQVEEPIEEVESEEV